MTFAGAMIYWVIGLPAVIAVFVLSRNWTSRAKRVHARAFALALGLGMALIPGHGEVIITPSTQLLVHGMFKSQPRGLYLMMGGGFFIANWLCALVALSLWKPRPSVVAPAAALAPPVESVSEAQPTAASEKL